MGVGGPTAVSAGMATTVKCVSTKTQALPNIHSVKHRHVPPRGCNSSDGSVVTEPPTTEGEWGMDGYPIEAASP